jgi:NAD(P) transhydrogenase subunit alpha
MGSNLIDALFVFMLAAFIGFEVIRHVSPLLHTPLMSLTNALDAIAVVGAIVLVGEHPHNTFATVLGVIAIIAATSNVVGGFVITDRMLKMFKTSRPTKAQGTKP